MVIVAVGAYDSIACDASDGCLVPRIPVCTIFKLFDRCDGAANPLLEGREPRAVARKIVKEESRPQGARPRRRTPSTGGG